MSVNVYFQVFLKSHYCHCYCHFCCRCCFSKAHACLGPLSLVLFGSCLLLSWPQARDASVLSILLSLCRTASPSVPLL